jgi:5-methylcytosine-specific restriction endonuclease McrA
MKFPNFMESAHFVRLKREMGIPPNQRGNLRAVEVRRNGATREEIRRLTKEGLEVEEADVIPLPDGTLSYRDRRVLLYIRDVSQYGGNDSDPKFHVSNCTTLRQMREHLRFGRFVIASRDDGLFHLHYINSGLREDKPLDVCQNCLDYLKYKGFQLSMTGRARRAAVHAFRIPDFFAAYPKTLHHYIPTYTDRTAPTNDYSPDFSVISRAYRLKRNWTCETCRIPLSKGAMQRHLHVHHINGAKNENNEENLKAVCVHCHALEPRHSHITAMRQYREFETIWHSWNKTRVDP